jgi:molybdenum cofactor cytidylyltransferase
MIPAERTVLVLLAAGKSTRFGTGGPKLDHDLDGIPLGLHAALTLGEFAFLDKAAVVGDATLDYTHQGFRILPNRDPARDMASSVRIGAEHAKSLHADALLIALADMPRITADQVQRLLDTGDGPGAVVASSDGTSAKPPALFGSARFDALLAVTGDRGARDLIRSARQIVTDPAELIDIDTRADLERALFGTPPA